jgi:hypothetical protein
VDVFEYAAGASVFNFDFCYERVGAAKEELGYVTLAGGSSGMTMGLMRVFAEH